MKTIWISGIVFLSLFAPGRAQLEKQLQTAIDEGRKEISALGLGVAVIHRDGKPMNFVSGEMSPGNPMKADAVFQIGSITKMYTAALVLKLVESKKIQLDDKISEWYPDLPNAKTISLKQLLNHTSGLDDIFQQPGFSRSLFVAPTKTWKIDSLLKKTGKPKFTPGSQWSYSSSGYLVLTGIIEKTTGKSFHQVLRDEIFKPLNLKRSFAGGFEDPKSPVVHAMIDINGDKKEEDLSAMISMKGFLTASAGAGGIVASPNDTAVFLHALMGGKLVKFNLKDWVKRSDGNQHGLGILKLKINEIELLGHRGNSGGFSNSAWHSEKLGITLVVCSNKNGIQVKPVVEKVLKVLKRHHQAANNQ